MREVKGDIWDYHDKGHWIVITTNGTVKRSGEAVMGRGIALQARQRLSCLPLELGTAIKREGNHVLQLHGGTISFPVKHNWQEKADIQLIERSCQELVGLVGKGFDGEVYMVRPGCGNGGLDWKDVKPILEKYLDDRFIVVERK